MDRPLRVDLLRVLVQTILIPDLIRILVFQLIAVLELIWILVQPVLVSILVSEDILYIGPGVARRHMVKKLIRIEISTP